MRYTKWVVSTEEICRRKKKPAIFLKFYALASVAPCLMIIRKIKDMEQTVAVWYKGFLAQHKVIWCQCLLCNHLLLKISLQKQNQCLD